MKRAIAFLLLLFLTLYPALSAHADTSTPGFDTFGYGVRFHPNGSWIEPALMAVYDLHPHWIAISLPWRQIQPSQSNSPDLSAYDAVMQTADAAGSFVMFSLTQPPDWALTPNGPNAELTTQLLILLKNRYPKSLRAVELFPSANTVKGWGALPNPEYYAQFFTTIRQRLNQAGMNDLWMIAAGLEPIDSTQIQGGNIPDTDFLQRLYQHNIQESAPIISLCLSHLSGDPLRPPNSQNPFLLRHYEEIRQIMLANQHANGLLWVTCIRPPDGTIDSDDRAYNATENELRWLKQALVQMRSQLYIGAVFIYDLNPEAPSSVLASHSLILGKSDRHPFYPVLKWIIRQEIGYGSTLPGQPKTQNLIKSRDRP